MRVMVNRTRTGVIPDWLPILREHLSIEDTEHDTLLTLMLEDSIDEVESYCNVSLIDSTIDLFISNATVGDMDYLLYSPVYEIISVEGCTVSQENSEIPTYVMTSESGKITYKAKFDSIPKGYQLAAIKLATTNFEIRGGFSAASRLTVMEYPNNWKKSLAPLRRRTFIV